MHLEKAIAILRIPIIDCADSSVLVAAYQFQTDAETPKQIDNVYQIENAAQLVGLQDIVIANQDNTQAGQSIKAKLLNDIQLQNAYLRKNESTFYGELDGNGHTITIGETNADGTKTKVADVKVSTGNQKEILKQAKEKKSSEIILVVSSKSVGDATKADVTLDKSIIDSIVKDTNAKLTIRTPFGDKTYTPEELKAMSEAATGSTVTVAIEKGSRAACR